MQITHQEARRLIQLEADEALPGSQKQTLDSHLRVCAECQQYANSLRRMESLLQPLMQRQWNRQPAPLSIAALASSVNQRAPAGMILATRIAVVSVMFVAFMISLWQFTLSNPSRAQPVLASIPPMPIPSTSTQLVSTITQSNTCKETIYSVGEHDTLASIAAQFSISSKEILTANQMKTDTVYLGMKLTIPLCHFTPTANALTTTYTPMFSPIISTPGG